MQSLKGIYKGGKVELLEDVGIDRTCKVIVTFIDDEDVEKLRNNAADEDAFEFWSEAEENIYQDYLKK